jgi:demethylmenaquinone methyltransferase/2-methoxy-6-polyprenyl-1,4-benzoquinol methylase
MASAGTTPPGTSGEKQASRWVQQMFSNIAPRYDLLNHLLSFNIDRSWRKVLLKRLAGVLAQPDARILDLCCGTGDVLLDLQAVSRSRIIGADFCHPMLVTAQRKALASGWPAPLIEGDAMELPLSDASLDAISIAFGFRNLVNYRAALTEFLRVLKPGGTLAILEFSHPPGAFMRNAYGIYSGMVLPAIGALISGSREAYTYLPESVGKFPKAEALKDMLTTAGFENSQFELLTGGVAALHLGVKPISA